MITSNWRNPPKWLVYTKPLCKATTLVFINDIPMMQGTDYMITTAGEIRFSFKLAKSAVVRIEDATRDA